MLTMLMVIFTLASSEASSQEPVGLSGMWVAEDTRMGAGGDAVASPIGAERLPRLARTPRLRELVIDERLDGVEIDRREGVSGRLSLPLTGLAVTTRDASGTQVTARALRDGVVLVIRREHEVRLPGGGEVVVEVEERHELLADGSLSVQTTSKAGALVETHGTLYRRVQR
jgi:hypothetical protein